MTIGFAMKTVDLHDFEPSLQKCSTGAVARQIDTHHNHPKPAVCLERVAMDAGSAFARQGDAAERLTFGQRSEGHLPPTSPRLPSVDDRIGHPVFPALKKKTRSADFTVGPMVSGCSISPLESGRMMSKPCMPYSARAITGTALRASSVALFSILCLLASACGPSAAQRQSASLMLQQGGSPSAADPGASTAYMPDEDFDDYSYRLAPGDIIDVKFPYHPEENERIPVRPDGLIDLQVVGDIEAAGLTVSELETEIVTRASRTLRDPVVSVVIAQLAEHKVYVGGDVLRPGFVNYREGLTPLQAVIERGGFTDTAKADQVLYITRIGEEVQAQRLDLESIIDGDSVEEIIMAPDDVVFVPKTWIGKADVWVDQWIRGLLPTVPRPGFDLNSLAF